VRAGEIFDFGFTKEAEKPFGADERMEQNAEAADCEIEISQITKINQEIIEGAERGPPEKSGGCICVSHFSTPLPAPVI